MEREDFERSLTRTTPGLLTVVFVIMMSLFVFTGFLARAYRATRQEKALQQFQAGQQLAEHGQYSEAIEQYRAALALSHDNDEYRQALALALVALGRTREAEAYLLDLLRNEPANGVANLTLARIYAQKGESEDTETYYRRAIYGLWPDNPAEHRVQARLELVELLIRQRAYMRAQAELLQLADEIPDDPRMKKRLGRLFLTVHSPAQAATLFQEVRRANSKDAEAAAGLGDALFERGDYLGAQAAYRDAVRHDPQDLQSHMQLELVTDVLSLDPSLRRISSAERYRRSQTLVERTLAAVDQCLSGISGLAPETTEALETARKLVAKRTRQRRSSEATDSNISLAEQLWQAGKSSCGGSLAPVKALSLVLEKLSK
jgi:tetratricopeptide (TPR) repeat protein